MSIKNRYIFLKRSYPQTIILFKNNGHIKSYNRDKMVLKSIKFKKIRDLQNKRINYLVINNLNIIKYQKFNNNNYNLYYLKVEINNLLKSIQDRIL